MDLTASLVNCTHLHMHDHCMNMTLFLTCFINTCFHTQCTVVYLDVHCTKGIWKLKLWRTLSLERDYVVLRLFQWVLTVGKWFSFCCINQPCRCWLKLSAVNIYWCEWRQLWHCQRRLTVRDFPLPWMHKHLLYVHNNYDKQITVIDGQCTVLLGVCYVHCVQCVVC